MPRHNIMYMPGINKTGVTRQTRGSRQGRGIGAVLLDGGMGGQSSYASLEQMMETINHPTAGRGLNDQLREKMKNLSVRPMERKVKNIKFSL